MSNKNKTIVATEEVSLDKLVIETQSPRTENDKTLFCFNDSLSDLRNRRYSRHLRPAEAMSVLIDSLENKAKSKHKDLAKDMLDSYGEWLSAAFKREGDNLLVYLDPENLKWNGNVYAIDKNRGILKNSAEFKFNIAEMLSQEYIDLKEFPTEFVELMYGRKYKDLPRAMRQGENKAQVYLANDKVLWPVGRGFINNYYVLYASFNYWASRGVRP